MLKYSALSEYLLKQNTISLSFDFQQIETLSHPQAKSWLNVGWKVINVDLKMQKVDFEHQLILHIDKVSDTENKPSLILATDKDDVIFILNGATASATSKYSWKQIVQTLIDVNPHLFGDITNQPDHYIFPEMLSELGYSIINWETGESWMPLK